MTYGNNIQFGYFLTPDAAAYPEVLRRAKVCDTTGYDLIGIQDHPYQSRFLDTWTLLAALYGQTEGVRPFSDVSVDRSLASAGRLNTCSAFRAIINLPPHPHPAAN